MLLFACYHGYNNVIKQKNCHFEVTIFYNENYFFCQSQAMHNKNL